MCASFLFISVIVAVWHYISFKIVHNHEKSFFYKDDKISSEKKFLEKEKIYEVVFKIKLWKDKIPQYVSKNGFSKKKLQSLNVNYLKDFISETYRAEANHILCCLIVPLLFLFSTIGIALMISFLVFIGNVPCIMIQRYNRFRIRRIILKINKKRKIQGAK